MTATEEATGLHLQGLNKTFGGEVRAVRDLSLSLRTGSFLTLLGPSGCGKTTTLRCVAGLESPDSGTIRIGDRLAFDAGTRRNLAPEHRHLGMVFQSYAVWPHMRVFDNVAYPLTVSRRHRRGEIRTRVDEMLDLVGLAEMGSRFATQLSGGQQQRVAIARALAGSPQALLFDEPLSNLDAKLRNEMRNELRLLQRRTGLTSIYVTHDQAEALAISDEIIVMRDGRIVERGRPVDIYRRPRHVFTAQFLGATNLIPGTIAAVDAAVGRLAVATALGQIVGIDPTGLLKAGASATVSIRPEDLAADAATAESLNTFEGQLAFAAFAGATVEAEIRCGDITIACHLDRDADLTPGRGVRLHAKPEACLVLQKE